MVKRSLSYEEIRMVLRGAEDLAGREGRSMLVLLLKGSKNRKLIQKGLNHNPAYGYYKDITMEEIDPIVDFCFTMGYLEMVPGYRRPVIAYTRKGEELERETLEQEKMEEL